MVEQDLKIGDMFPSIIKCFKNDLDYAVEALHVLDSIL